MEPWLINNRLTRDRLVIVGQLLKEVRDEAVELHDVENGDGVWSLGCRVYERSINRLTALARTNKWIQVHRDNLFFVMLLDGVPIRFYHGDAQEPTSRTLRKTASELHNEQTDFGFVEGIRMWRIAVETNADSTTLRICIAQYDNEGDAHDVWEIPVTDRVTPIGMISDSLPDAISIPAPVVKGLNKESGVAAHG